MKRRNIIFMFLLIQSLLADVALANSDKRLALIIGNATYRNGNSLRNPANDARLMSDSLKALGFDIIMVTDADKTAFERSVYEFVKKLPAYNTSLFFYAGHGIQVDGINYLIPVDAVLEEKTDVKFQAIPVSFVTEELDRYPEKISIIILDACRNNPFKSWMRGSESSLRRIVNQPAGSIIAYATRENSTASDGTGKNGLYTQMLVGQLMKPQSIHEMFNNTRYDVLEKSKYSQCPQEWNMLTRPFYFVKPSANIKPPAIAPTSNKLYADKYSLYYADTLDADICKVTEFEIFDVTDTTFKIQGLGGQEWSGVGVIHKDNTGRYDWIFDNGSKGSSYIRINKHGSIKGRVSGSNVDLEWVYIAYPMN